jgi:hypothetical protein
MQHHSSVASSNVVVEHPACEQCKAPMWLARLESDKPDHGKRTFECKACGATKIEIVKY